MGSLTLIAVGFLLVTAVVIALARSSTARWERDRRASVAVRADGAARRPRAPDAVLGRFGALTRARLAALRHQVSRFPLGTVLARVLPKGVLRGRARVRPIRRLAAVLRSSLLGGTLRWTKSRSPARPADDGAETALAPAPSRAVTALRAHGVAKAASRLLSRRTVRRGRRRALAFLHRNEAHDAVVPHDDGQESPAAR